MKKKFNKLSNLKSDGAFSGKNKKTITQNAKRAYIALLIALGIVTVSVYTKSRQELLNAEKTVFDEAAWQEAIEDSGVSEDEIYTATDVVIPEDTEEVPMLNDEGEIPEDTDAGALTEEDLLYTEAVAASSEADGENFIYPSNGEVIKEFSGDQLVYNEATEDFRTHNGMDFKMTEGEQVVAVFDGIVKKVEKDDLWGVVVEIEHPGGIVTRYAGLQSEDFISVGKQVKKGDIIGGAGKSGVVESGAAHLHFEILKSGEYENPGYYFVK